MIGAAAKSEDERYEIRFSGSGGQGLITAAIIFAEAVGVHAGKYVCQTQSYGPEARGGKSRAEVVVSDSPIDYPKALALDMLLAMNQAACDAYFYDLKANGLLVVDSSLVEQFPTSRVIAVPFTDIARDKVGREMVANMVALGTIGVLTGQILPDELKETMLGRVPRGTEDLNRTAFDLGVEQGRKVNIDDLPRAVMNEEDEL